jgi:hypothetical protein
VDANAETLHRHHQEWNMIKDAATNFFSNAKAMLTGHKTNQFEGKKKK